MSNVVMATTVMLTLLLLMPLFAYTPNVVLAAIIIAAVVGLVDVPAACNIWKLDKVDFLVCLSSFLGVVFVSVQQGLAIAGQVSTETCISTRKLKESLGSSSLPLKPPLTSPTPLI
ncbi:hypothetical protein GW17_00003222 [Ensete ventricosum]|nr:hypothetical protein GW17_00003222 [Ensete ventricosum]